MHGQVPSTRARRIEAESNAALGPLFVSCGTTLPRVAVPVGMVLTDRLIGVMLIVGRVELAVCFPGPTALRVVLTDVRRGAVERELGHLDLAIAVIEVAVPKQAHGVVPFVDLTQPLSYAGS